MRADSIASASSLDRTIEVVVLWGERSVLHAAHLSSSNGFCVGEHADFAMSEASLGMARWPVVRSDAGESWVVVPHDASCQVVRADQPLSDESLSAYGLSRRSAELAGAREIRVEGGMAMRIEHRGFSFVVRELAAERIAMPGLLASTDEDARRRTLGSIAAQALLLFGMYFLVPPSIVRSVDVVNTQSRLVRYAIEENMRPPEPMPAQASDDGKPGKAHEGEPGHVGKPNPTRDCKSCGARAKPTAAPAISREQQKAMAMNAGIAGILRSLSGDVSDVDSPYSAANALDGNDAEQLLALFGPNAGEARGLFGGLGPIGSGRGGGGDGKGTLGLDRIGTLGGRDGHGEYGGASVAGLAGRQTRVPRIRSPEAAITGSLSKETVRRTIGLHIPEVRHCYTQALTSRPELQGRVVVQFVISPSGAVTKAVVKESSLDDPKTAQCIADVVNRIDFPAPQGGLVIVSYPFVLSQV